MINQHLRSRLLGKMNGGAKPRTGEKLKGSRPSQRTVARDVSSTLYERERECNMHPKHAKALAAVIVVVVVVIAVLSIDTMKSDYSATPDHSGRVAWPGFVPDAPILYEYIPVDIYADSPPDIERLVIPANSFYTLAIITFLQKINAQTIFGTNSHRLGLDPATVFDRPMTGIAILRQEHPDGTKVEVAVAIGDECILRSSNGAFLHGFVPVDNLYYILALLQADTEKWQVESEERGAAP